MENQTSHKNRTLGYLFGMLGVLIFSGTLPMTRLGTETFDPWFLTFSRATIVSIVSAIVFLLLKKRLPRQHLFSLFMVGVFLVFGFPGFMAVAMTTVPASHGGVVLGILPLVTALFAVILAGERPSLLFWLCGIVGAILVIVFALRDGGWGIETGDFWLLAAGACAGAGYVLSGKLAGHMGGWEVVSWALVLTSPMSAVLTWWTWNPIYLEADARAIMALSYVAFGSMYLGFFAWNAGLNLGGIARIGQLQLFQTFLTIGFAAALLGEQITLEMLFFATAVFAVVFVGRKAQVGMK